MILDNQQETNLMAFNGFWSQWAYNQGSTRVRQENLLDLRNFDSKLPGRQKLDHFAGSVPFTYLAISSAVANHTPGFDFI